MLSPKPLETIHDLFATTRHPSDEQSAIDIGFQGDVYEELDKLDYIYVDELTEKA